MALVYITLVEITLNSLHVNSNKGDWVISVLYYGRVSDSHFS